MYFGMFHIIVSGSQVGYCARIHGIRGEFQMHDLIIGKTTILGTLRDVPSELLAERFLLFYRKKIEDLRHGLEPNPVIESELCKHKLSQFSKVSIETAHQLIVDSPSKSCSLDPMPTPVFKQCVPSLIPFITHLINVSIITGTVPSSFKSAIIRPLLKKPNLNPDILKNYRPVSNLSFLIKVLERSSCQSVKVSIGLSGPS